MAALADLYPGSAHVRDVALAPAPDRAIWAHARDHGFVIVSKDEDFHRERRQEIEAFVAHEEAAFLALA